MAAAAAIPLLTSTLYLTFSRGASWSTLVGVGAYLVVARPRGLIGAALATVPTTLAALMAVNPADAITRYPRLSSEAVSTGHRTALVVLACMVAAAAIRAAALGLDKRVEVLRFPPGLGRRALLGAGVASLVLVLVGSAAFHVPSVVAEKYRTFKSEDTAPGGSGSSRLLSPSDNGRLEHWRVALDGFEENHLRGTGAGTYQILWARERPSTVMVHDGHSLYVETLGELGLVGLSLVVICLLTLLIAFARRARGPDRELFAALLAAGIAWSLAASVDWVWEMPAISLWLFALGGAALARTPRTREGGDRPARRRAGMLVLRGAAVAVCLLLALLPGRLAVSQAHVEKSIERMHTGDCRSARAEARRSLDYVSQRAAPHHIIAWCLLTAGRPRAAVAELAEARRQDPDSWVLLEATAVARAAAGLDPVGALSRAQALNPQGELAQSVSALAPRSRRARARIALQLPVPLPELGQPWVVLFSAWSTGALGSTLDSCGFYARLPSWSWPFWRSRARPRWAWPPAAEAVPATRGRASTARPTSARRTPPRVTSGSTRTSAAVPLRSLSADRTRTRFVGSAKADEPPGRSFAAWTASTQVSTASARSTTAGAACSCTTGPARGAASDSVRRGARATCRSSTRTATSASSPRRASRSTRPRRR
jgi:hypothetical protein